jgi:hypothetical protein
MSGLCIRCGRTCMHGSALCLAQLDRVHCLNTQKLDRSTQTQLRRDGKTPRGLRHHLDSNMLSLRPLVREQTMR